MRVYIINADNLIVSCAAPSQPSDDEIVVASIDELRAARLSGKRLLALWNGLPGVGRLSKVGNREALVDRLWSALQALPDPQSARPSKQAEVIALLRRPEGATVEEVRAATGPGCVKTRTKQECAELFSLLPSPDNGGQRYWFSD